MFGYCPFIIRKQGTETLFGKKREMSGAVPSLPELLLIPGSYTLIIRRFNNQFTPWIEAFI